MLCRPQQPTLGSLVLVCKEDVGSFGAVSANAFAELRRVVAAAEAVLSAFTGYERINHLMLMMVDPAVHFHVIPRYREARQFDGIAFPDRGWPGPPALSDAVTPPLDALAALVSELRARWPAAPA